MATGEAWPFGGRCVLDAFEAYDIYWHEAWNRLCAAGGDRLASDAIRCELLAQVGFTERGNGDPGDNGKAQTKKRKGSIDEDREGSIRRNTK